MTTIYVPRLIESAEQAEALPIGTPVLTVLTDHGEEERVVGADYIDDSFDEDLTPGGNFHHVALVPIEAEEVHVTARGLLELDMHGRPDVNHDVTDPRRYQRTEWHTPWERQN